VFVGVEYRELRTKTIGGPNPLPRCFPSLYCLPIPSYRPSRSLEVV